MTLANQIVPVACSDLEAMESLMEYALAAYSHPEDQFHIFDKETIERKDKEYEKWCKSLHHSPAIPLGLKQEDYILKGLSLQEEIEEREEEEEEEESEEEEEEEEEVPDQMNDYYEGDSDILDGNMTPPPEVEPLHFGDMT